MKPILLLLSFAAALIASDKYTVYESEHFELITDGSRGRAQEILAQFERVRSFFVKAMAMRDPVLKPRIVVFQNDKDYRDYAPSAVTAAHYMSLPQRDYIAIGAGTGERDKRVAVHEYLHLLVRYTDLDMPLWMNEGVAELYSNIETVKKVVRVGTPIPEHVFLIRNDWLPLQDLFVSDHDSKFYNRRQHVGPFYGISWALVHMLTLDNRYRPGYAKFSQMLSDGVAADAAVTQAYGKTVAELEADLKAYIQRNQVNVVNYEMQFDKVDEKLPGRPATAYEWDLATADLLMGVRKYTQAAARMEALTHMEPKRPEAWESRAFTAWVMKGEGAEEAFRKARELGSVSPYLAYWAPGLTKDPKVALAALKEAVAKHPQYVEARIRLAEQLLSEREPQAAYDTLKAIGKINRRQVQLYFPPMIQTAWFLDKIEEARVAASQFVKLSVKPAERERALKLFALAMKDRPKAQERDTWVEVPAAVTAPAAERDAGEWTGELPVAKTPMLFTTGALVNLECKEPGVLHVKTDSGISKLVIDDPTKLQMAGAEDGKGELTCGAQSRRVKVGYYPREGTGGVARTIEFLP